MSSNRVVCRSDAASSASFGETITLHNGAAESNFEEVKHSKIDGSRSSDHILDLSSEECFDFVENQEVVASTSVGSISIKGLTLRGKSLSSKPSFAASCSVKLSFYLSIDTVV
jgi:hypothetical protein